MNTLLGSARRVSPRIVHHVRGVSLHDYLNQSNTFKRDFCFVSWNTESKGNRALQTLRTNLTIVLLNGCPLFCALFSPCQLLYGIHLLTSIPPSCYPEGPISFTVRVTCPFSRRYVWHFSNLIWHVQSILWKIQEIGFFCPHTHQFKIYKIEFFVDVNATCCLEESDSPVFNVLSVSWWWSPFAFLRVTVPMMMFGSWWWMLS